MEKGTFSFKRNLVSFIIHLMPQLQVNHVHTGRQKDEQILEGKFTENS